MLFMYVSVSTCCFPTSWSRTFGRVKLCISVSFALGGLAASGHWQCNVLKIVALTSASHEVAVASMSWLLPDASRLCRMSHTWCSKYTGCVIRTGCIGVTGCVIHMREMSQRECLTTKC